ncbi:MAG: hypothetical protein BYD32DRAFT_422803, partial [Podila humilis]
MMVGSPGLSIDTRSARLSPPLASQLSHHNSRERILSVSSSTSSLSSEHSYPSFQRGSIDLRTKLANNSPPQQPRSPNSPHLPTDRIEVDPSGRYVISPRLAPSLLPKSPSQTHQPSPSSPTASLRGFPAGYRPGHVRRRDGSASSLTIPFDPYRSRQSQSPSAKRTKNGKAFYFFFFAVSSHPWDFCFSSIPKRRCFAFFLLVFCSLFYYYVSTPLRSFVRFFFFFFFFFF